MKLQHIALVCLLALSAGNVTAQILHRSDSIYTFTDPRLQKKHPWRAAAETFGMNAISTSTVIRKLNDFRFKHDFSLLPEIMSWDEYAWRPDYGTLPQLTLVLRQVLNCENPR